MDRLFTIGAYGFDADTFFDALQGANIDLFIDIRRRRGVRGAEYAFANAGRLTQALEARDIPYRHVIALAPNDATRALQAREDESHHVARRKRASLSPSFIDDYTQRTLEPFDWQPLLQELEGFQRPVLFCVERTPEACHRGLVAAHLREITGVPVTNLVPASSPPAPSQSSSSG